MIDKRRILITGATGQIGSELTEALRRRYGADHIVAAGHKKRPGDRFIAAGPFCFLDVRDREMLYEIIEKQGIGTIYHLASLLSAVAEQNPQLAWDINVNGLINVLEAAAMYRGSVFFPSSIGAFGPNTPAVNTPQDTIQRPNTLYGVTKVAGELLCDYYYKRYDVDARGVRFPGLISYVTPPGGGTTDYAVDIFYAAIREKRYRCFLNADTRLDMMYMPDAIEAGIRLMEADAGRLIHRNAFNVTAMSFTPGELADEIVRHIPDFKIEYEVDSLRQAIAESWPRSMDDSAARNEWDWSPKFDMPVMVKDMLEKIADKVNK